METAVVFIIGGVALAALIGHLRKSLKKDDACSGCSSKSCSSGNPDCSGKP